MFTPRWSTCLVLCCAALAAVLGFSAGNYFRAAVPQQLHIDRDGLKAAESAVALKPLAESVQTSELTVVRPENPIAICEQLFARPATPARNAELLAALEKLARQDPARALALAEQETNLRWRRQLLEAVLRGWGRGDAAAAAAWALTPSDSVIDSTFALAAVLQGAVDNPDAATALTQQLAQKNPEQARDYGDALIYALGRDGNFQRAADFAVAGTGALREEWLAAAYGNWANYQPQTAAANALRIADEAVRHAALDAVTSGWGQADPQGLANFALGSLTDERQKTHALSDALTWWVGSNPVAAAEWINQFGPAPEFDSGAAALATQPEVMKQPQLAINWAETISDANLRSRTVVAILDTWLLADRSGALNFAQSSSDLTPEDRDALYSRLNASAF